MSRRCRRPERPGRGTIRRDRRGSSRRDTCPCPGSWAITGAWPTTRDRQGNDAGPSYRSAIFYANDAQKKVAQSYIAQLSKAGVFGAPIVTQLTPLQGFYPAEDYHQDYLLLNPTAPYIAYNDLPKIRNFQRLLPVLYQAKAVTVTELKH